MKTRAIASRRSLRANLGLSLVELMIAMTLGLATVGAIGWVYLGSSKTYRTQDAIARLQEGARYAFEVVANDLRMAGATACGYSTNSNVINNPTTRWYTNFYDQPVNALEQNNSSGTVTEFGDALSVLHADVSREYIVSNHNPTGTFTLTAAHDITPGTLLLATDCNHVVIFQADAATTGAVVGHAASGTPGNSTANLGNGGPITYAAGARIYRLSASRYYLDTNPAGVRSLYRERPSGAAAAPLAEELVEGVEGFQVSFGVDTTNVPDGQVDRVAGASPYVTGPQITNGTITMPGSTAAERWRRVVSVRISLLLATTEDAVVPIPQTYTFNGTETLAADKRLRKVFTHVVRMRNK